MTAQPPSCSAEDRPERVAHVRRAAIGLARVARVSPWLLRAGLTPRRLRPPGGRRVLMLTIGDVANDPRVHKVARSLAASEYEVDVLAPALGAAGERTLEPGVRVVEVERKWLWRFFVLYQDEFRAAGLARSFDYVHANDLTTLTVGWVLARIRGVPLVYDAHELWAENVEPSGDGWAPMSSRTRLLARTWERFLLRSVDVAVTVGPSIANELA